MNRNLPNAGGSIRPNLAIIFNKKKADKTIIVSTLECVCVPVRTFLSPLCALQGRNNRLQEGWSHHSVGEVRKGGKA
jgi:hypothetical protein